jgi:hypothetical protein
MQLTSYIGGDSGQLFTHKKHQGVVVPTLAICSSIYACASSIALRDNPGLPTLTAAEKWNGVLPTTMVPGNALPFLNLAK